jgi:adenine-specific DNA-methyltransferase
MIKDIQTHNAAAAAGQKEMEALRRYFPQCFTADGAFSIEALAAALPGGTTLTDETSGFNWLGKNYARMLCNMDTTTLIRPDEEHNALPENRNSQNVYISGDNLDALQHLVKSYSGQVKVIYIDPPYNTGSDGFVYNDRFNFTTDDLARRLDVSPERAERILSMTRRGSASHAAWLTFMLPRLSFARDLLTDDGVIFISIDDNEQANLKKLCDEVFGEENLVANISWQKTYSPRNDSKGVPTEVEYILAYGKNEGWTPKKLPRTEKMDAKYSNPDNDVMPWTSDNPCAPGAKTHQGMVYAIQHPFTGEMLYPATSSCWRYEQGTMLEYMSGWCDYELKDLNDEEQRARICGVDASEVRKGIKAIVLKNSLEESKMQAEAVLKRGQWPRFYFTRNGQGGIRRKTYLENVDGKMVTNLWPYSEVGHTDEAKKELKALFEGEIPFDTPKPVRLIQRILQIATNKGDLVLDFFSGSATTAQAVMQHNSVADDGGERKFILVQIPDKVNGKWGDLCTIGMERIKRAAKKIREANPLFAGDLGFKHYVLEEPKEDALLLMERFDPSTSALSTLTVADFGLPTVLRTWLVADGYGLTADAEELMLGRYKAYWKGDHLYMVNPDDTFDASSIVALMDRYNGTPFSPHNIVIFGYSFGFNHREELQKNLRTLKEGNKTLTVNIDVRY